MAKLTAVADGKKMRKEREEANLTVDELVALLKEEGVHRHPDTIRNVELGHAQPGLKLFNAYVRILGHRTGITREDLLATEDAPATETPQHQPPPAGSKEGT